MIPNLNDGDGASPQLRCYINMLAVNTMPRFVGAALPAKLDAIQSAGYDGVQFVDPMSADELALCRSLGLGMAQSGRINLPAEADELAARFAGEGVACATIHLGWGLESDAEGARLIEALLNASAKHRVPLYPETHRATLFQDMWRTVEFLKTFPELRFNGDFSHWYTGSEMVYGDFETKLAFIAPALERVRFLHGRIGNPGAMQVDIGDGPAPTRPFVAHFQQIWTAAMRGFLQSAAPGDYLCFTPELLAPEIYYAREITNSSGVVVEESDRWQQSLVLRKLAQECFALAQRNNSPTSS